MEGVEKTPALKIVAMGSAEDIAAFGSSSRRHDLGAKECEQ
jgi:hypothetical protein